MGDLKFLSETHHMTRSIRRLPAVLASVVLAGSLLGTSAGASTSTAYAVNPNIRAHPFLQVGAQAEPSKLVTVLVSKTSSKISSSTIAKAVPTSVQQDFPTINTFTLTIPQKAVLALANTSGVRYVTPNLTMHTTAIDASQLKTTYEGTLGTPTEWNGAAPLGATGQGVTVAVLDTGVNPKLADLSADLVCTMVKSNSCNDGHGHGTHVIGILKGNDALGRYIGVAPNARVISVKIADDTGAATAQDVVNGLQWVYNNRTTYNIRVVNLSFSDSVAESYASSAIDAYIEQLWLAGVVVVTAAGNNGTSTDATWYAPGNDPYAISVGALDDNLTIDPSDDSLASFSSRGATQDGFYKPEVVAPGRKIVSTLAGPSVTLATTYPDRIVDTNYIRLSGTSMAAPVAAGTVALLLEKFPTLTPDQVKFLLTSTARPYHNQADTAAMVNPANLLQQAAIGSIATANQGLTPSAALDPTTSTVSTSSYWNQSYWNQSYWNQSYWNQESSLD
jgi:serine protease AprX